MGEKISSINSDTLAIFAALITFFTTNYAKKGLFFNHYHQND